MISDPIVEEVRIVREQLAARHDYDIHRIMADARLKQQQYASRLVSFDKGPMETVTQSHQREGSE